MWPAAILGLVKDRCSKIYFIFLFMVTQSYFQVVKRLEDVQFYIVHYFNVRIVVFRPAHGNKNTWIHE